MIFLLAVVAFAACKPKPVPVQPIQIPDTTAKAQEKRASYKPAEVIGEWKSHEPWNNREVTLKVRSDSTMVFIGQVSKEGKKQFFVTIGDWFIRNDSILEMKQITDGRRYDPKDLFPELYASGDSANIIAAPVTATYIIGETNLYNIAKDGTREMTQYFDRIKK
ncbi:MAG: hypothetical protein ACRC3B_00835 [Bacteroidia bacterium]